MNRLIISVVVSLLILYSMASATIINIPNDYLTIQEGIDASFDGDTVLVQPGIYVENINFNGYNITLASLFLTTGDTSYISQTIIDGDSSGSVVTFENGEDNTTVITGFRIQNGIGTVFIEDSRVGGGIFCNSYSSPTKSNNMINGNSTESAGGGIFGWESTPTIINNTISGNSANGSGGGICCMYYSSPTISNNTISGNSANRGGGICYTSSSPTIRNNTINGNTAGSDGGGIYCSVFISVITNTIFRGDSAPTGPEIYLSSSSG